MVERVSHAIPIDVVRRVDSSIEQADIGDEYSLSVSRDVILAHIEGVEREFERRAIELTDQQSVEELHEGVDRDFGYTVYLDQPNVKPLDPEAGDTVEVRTGDDTFTDVTDQSFVDTDAGIIEVDTRLIQLHPYFPQDTNYRFRVTYRFGGDADESGETTLDQPVSDSTSLPVDIDVTDAESLATGDIVLLGTTEYALVSATNTDTDTITLSQRGLRGTAVTTHDSGEQVVNLPVDVRDAVSAKVATRLLRQDNFLDTLTEGEGDAIDTSTKIEQLEEEFEQAVSRYTTTAGYI